jgi:hypothetical protein
MSDTSKDTVPDNLAGMLPVGMINGGGTAAAAMAQVAQRKRGVPGWEAFHYERISPTEFEVTGGVAVNIGGVKKFQTTDDALTVTEAEVLAAMRAAQEVVPPVPQALLEQDLLAADIGKTVSGTEQQFLKVVFACRCCWQAKNLAGISVTGEFFGAKVQACSLHETQPYN